MREHRRAGNPPATQRRGGPSRRSVGERGGRQVDKISMWIVCSSERPEEVDAVNARWRRLQVCVDRRQESLMGWLREKLEKHRVASGACS